MFKNLFKRTKPRVFLGALAIAPRSDIKRYFDEWGIYKVEDLDAGLRRKLKEIFSLPLVQEATDLKHNDLGLDVVIPKFQSGDYAEFPLGDFDIPLIWRPKLTISSRLYYLKSEKTKATFSVTEKLNWNEYFIRLFSWRGFFRVRQMFGEEDMERLLYKACLKLLLKMQKSI